MNAAVSNPVLEFKRARGATQDMTLRRSLRVLPACFPPAELRLKGTLYGSGVKPSGGGSSSGAWEGQPRRRLADCVASVRFVLRVTVVVGDARACVRG